VKAVSEVTSEHKSRPGEKKGARNSALSHMQGHDCMCLQLSQGCCACILEGSRFTRGASRIV
jgi:hypothetical protein